MSDGLETNTGARQAEQRRTKTENEGGHGGFRSPLPWPTDAASVAATIAQWFEISGHTCPSLLFPSPSTPLFSPLPSVLLASLATCTSFSAVSLTEVHVEREMCRLVFSLFFCTFSLFSCRFPCVTTRQCVTLLVATKKPQQSPEFPFATHWNHVRWWDQQCRLPRFLD